MNIKRFLPFILTLILSIVFSQPAFATDVSGTITSNTTWSLANSPYVVKSNLLVEESATLAIDPGVEVQFDGNYAILIEGLLLASGTSADKIVFTSGDTTPNGGDWNHILLTSTSKSKAGTHKMEHCVVQYGGGFDNNFGTIRITEGANATISNCTISNNASQGIYVDYGGNITITNSTLESNFGYSGAGIYIYSDSSHSTEISGCIIRDNQASYYGGGISVDGYSNVDIDQCIISGNSADDGGGIFTETNESFNVTNSLIYNNSADDYGGGIYLYDGEILEFDNNVIYANEAEYGGGLYIYYINGDITNNIVAENMAEKGGGIYILSYYDNTTISGNSVIRNITSGNSSDYGGGIYAKYLDDTILDDNTIVGNESTSFGDSGGIYLYDSYYSVQEISHMNGNNIFDNSGVDVYSQIEYDSNHIDATNCYWGTTDTDTIEDMIYDFFDDPTLEVIEYDPFLSKINPHAPPPPPSDVTLTETKAGSVTLTWKSVAAGDLAGYKVYYDQDGDFPFDGTGLTQGDSPIDVGFVTESTLKGLSEEGAYYFAVAAYDDGTKPGPGVKEGWVSERVKYGSDSDDDDDSGDDDSDDDSDDDDNVPLPDGDESLNPRDEAKSDSCCG